MTRGNAPGQLVVAVLYEAVKRFGRINAQNEAQVVKWVQKRVNELTKQAEKPEPRDGRALAAGRDA